MNRTRLQGGWSTGESLCGGGEDILSLRQGFFNPGGIILFFGSARFASFEINLSVVAVNPASSFLVIFDISIVESSGSGPMVQIGY